MQNDNFTTRPNVLGYSTVQCVTAYKLLGIIVSTERFRDDQVHVSQDGRAEKELSGKIFTSELPQRLALKVFLDF